MLRLLSEENLNGDIVRGMLRQHVELNLVRAQDVGLTHTPDPEILAWSARENRVLVSHDISTVPPAAYARIAQGLPMPGVFIVPDQMAIGQAIAELLFLALNFDAEEWRDQILFLPV